MLAQPRGESQKKILKREFLEQIVWIALIVQMLFSLS